MKELQYKTFSLRTHKKNWQVGKPNVCQFELTFGCDLHCRHCYSDCYNKPSFIKKELNIEQVKFIIDKVYNAGVVWLCFTGGDPLTRKDFLEIYSYAKNKGLIVIVFTNSYSMNKEITDYLQKSPPFVVEITLNAVTEETYEKISQLKGSFTKAMDGLKMMTERKIPLKIKTQVTKDNLEELPKIREFIRNLGLNFRPIEHLQARLNKDLTPCSLRIDPEELIKLNKGIDLNSIEEECKFIDNQVNKSNEQNEQNNYLFSCAISGGDGINIDPFGNLIPCNCIREPKVNLFKENIEDAYRKILNWIRARHFTAELECKSCSIRNLCYNCPGKALLEKGNLEAKIDWFCELAHLIAAKKWSKPLGLDTLGR